jgi:aldehyde oxidoreductase
VLCRCTGYRKIIDAVLAAGERHRAPARRRSVGAADPERLDGIAARSTAPSSSATMWRRRTRCSAGDPLAPSPCALRSGDLDGLGRGHASGIVAVLTADDVPGTPTASA